MQETNLSSGLVASAVDELSDDPALEALREELAKWQARVPKLAGALRERTNEVASLRAELDARAELPAADRRPSNSGIEARDALIEELEAKARALGSKYQDAEGQLHARDLEISQLRNEAQEWREKWQSVTNSLDQQADNSSQIDRELTRVRGELDELLGLQEARNSTIKEQDLELTALRERSQSLESRNENLFETTELANRQIETLGDNLAQLRADLKSSKQVLVGRDEEVGGHAGQIEDLKTQIASRDQDIEFLHGHVEEKQTELNSLGERITELKALEAVNAQAERVQEKLTGTIAEKEAEVSLLSERLTGLDETRADLTAAQDQLRAQADKIDASHNQNAAGEAKLASLNEDFGIQKVELRRLEECVATAEEATSRFEAERRQISGQLDELRNRNQHLEAQLSERSDLVVGLEEEKSAISDKTSSLEAENKRLSEVLEKSQQAAAGNADHIAHVDARLERQKQLMENLEEEFAEAQEALADAGKEHQRQLTEKALEIAALQERVDEDSVEVLKAQLLEVEETLAATRASTAETETSLNGMQTSAEQHQQQVENLERELDQKKSQDDAVREQLRDKVQELEKQLRKQSKAAAEAEDAHAVARQALEDQKAVDSRVPDDVSGENAFLQGEVIKLEGMVRERTEQLNKLRWQQDMIEKQSSGASGEGSESKMLVVLNQQLVTARDDNQRLREKVRELEARPETASVPDDLARIKGIGPKLVKQLAKLGVTQFDQIATLSEADLDDVDHPLHGMKGRVVKDNWIEQAARLGGASDTGSR